MTGPHYLPPWADNARIVTEARIVAEPDPLFAELARSAELYHPGGVHVCPVEGCGWVLRVDPPVLVEVPELGPRWVGAPVEQVEQHLALHADWHATGGAPPVDDEPEGWSIP